MEMLFLIVVFSSVYPMQLLAFGIPQIKQRLYCCLLFFFNFFQYVKELFYPGKYSYFLFLYLLYQAPVMVENNGVEPLTSCVQGRRSSQLS